MTAFQSQEADARDALVEVFLAAEDVDLDAEEEERRAERLKRREERRTKRGFMENGYTEGETPVPIDS